MTTYEALLEAVHQNPREELPRGILADFLEDEGRTKEAAEWRAGKMLVYQVGPDEEEPYGVTNPERFAWIVVDYTVGDYSGSGEAVALNIRENKLYIKGLGHCSCFGPWEGWDAECDKVPVDEWLASRSIDGALSDRVESKVRELINSPVPPP